MTKLKNVNIYIGTNILCISCLTLNVDVLTEVLTKTKEKKTNIF